jgi:hypothetical protein
MSLVFSFVPFPDYGYPGYGDLGLFIDNHPVWLGECNALLRWTWIDLVEKFLNLFPLLAHDARPIKTWRKVSLRADFDDLVYKRYNLGGHLRGTWTRNVYVIPDDDYVLVFYSPLDTINPCVECTVVPTSELLRELIRVGTAIVHHSVESGQADDPTSYPAHVVERWNNSKPLLEKMLCGQGFRAG